MSKVRPKTRVSVARNLRALMELAHLSQRDLESKSGVSQRQISNILSQSTSCSVETAEALARPFGLEGWHLLLPDLPASLVASPSIGKLVSAYLHASAATRQYMDDIAAHESKLTNGD